MRVLILTFILSNFCLAQSLEDPIKHFNECMLKCFNIQGMNSFKTCSLSCYREVHAPLTIFKCFKNSKRGDMELRNTLSAMYQCGDVAQDLQDLMDEAGEEAQKKGPMMFTPEMSEKICDGVKYELLNFCASPGWAQEKCFVEEMGFLNKDSPKKGLKKMKYYFKTTKVFDAMKEAVIHTCSNMAENKTFNDFDIIAQNKAEQHFGTADIPQLVCNFTEKEKRMITNECKSKVYYQCISDSLNNSCDKLTE